MRKLIIAVVVFVVLVGAAELAHPFGVTPVGLALERVELVRSGLERRATGRRMATVVGCANDAWEYSAAIGAAYNNDNDRLTVYVSMIYAPELAVTDREGLTKDFYSNIRVILTCALGMEGWGSLTITNSFLVPVDTVDDNATHYRGVMDYFFLFHDRAAVEAIAADNDTEATSLGLGKEGRVSANYISNIFMEVPTPRGHTKPELVRLALDRLAARDEAAKELQAEEEVGG